MRVAVFCASSDQVDEVYLKEARRLGEAIGQLGWELIYGGTNLGLMKEVAEATIKNGGNVTGIIPECIYRHGVAAEEVGQLLVVSDMKERKQLMQLYADAFVALPGGWGTLEEVTQMITLKQLGEHRKAIVFLNTAGFYDGLMTFICSIQEKGFISAAYNHLYEVVKEVQEVIDYLKKYENGDVLKSKY